MMKMQGRFLNSLLPVLDEHMLPNEMEETVGV